jgi:hypothetical protein
MLLEGLDKLKKCNDLIGTPIRVLPACSRAPQPSTPLRALHSAISNFVQMCSVIPELLLMDRRIDRRELRTVAIVWIVSNSTKTLIINIDIYYILFSLN